MAAAASENFDRAFRSLRSGKCEDAASALNAGLGEGDRDAYFLAGFMFARGVCVSSDGARAARLRELATKAGQGDAAMELVLLHGMGRGVPQSYAEAGRWARAARDILALKVVGESQASAAASGTQHPRFLDVEYASRLGYSATIHALAGDEVRAKGDEAIFRLRESMVTVRVVVAGPGLPLHIEAGKNGGALRDVSTVSVFGTGALVGIVRASYEKAMNEAPALVCPQTGCAPLRTGREYEFRVH
jgi:hypothetical protein